MRTSKNFGWVCLIVILCNFIVLPWPAAGASGSELPFLAQHKPFDRQLLISDVSNRELPSGRTLEEDNFFAERELPGFEYPSSRTLDEDDIFVEEQGREVRLWEPTGEQLRPVAFLLPDLPESVASNRRAVTCTVTSAADSGAGTLRSCLTSLAAGDVILFDPTVFPPASPQTIYLTSELPGILQNNVTVDASNAGVIVNGSAITEDAFGLVIWGAQGVTIRGLQILDFTLGILIGNGASYNIIGGDRAIGAGPMGQGNLISGNSSVGVVLQNTGTSHNAIRGNLIGTNLSGDGAVGNGYAGIVIVGGASRNVVGGSHSPGMCDGACNLISGNQVGIHIEGAETHGNQVLGNFIGTNLAGNSANPNTDTGLIIWGAPENLIGGAHNLGVCDGPCNLISGNVEVGILIRNLGSNENKAQGNFIGINAAGDAPLPNKIGLVLVLSASNNEVGGIGPGVGNLVSGNSLHGVLLQSVGTSHNIIQGNIIGTDLSGNVAIGNGFAGLVIVSGATQNVVGGDHSPGACDGACNLISGNEVGIQIQDAQGNQVLGNFIGTNLQGNGTNSNRYTGVVIWNASQNSIGGLGNPDVCDGPCNLISGNIQQGIEIIYPQASANKVQGNFIGTNATGDAPLPNNNGLAIGLDAKNNKVGGTGMGEGNLVSGNENFGIWLSGEDTTGNQVLGNRIGTDITGFAAVPNYRGIHISNSPGNQIGGAESGVGNLISGNHNQGIFIEAVISANIGTTISGNKIGTNLSGTAALPNYSGIVLAGGDANQIEGNLISGNIDDGIIINTSSANRVQGNIIGADLSGGAAIPNRTGIDIRFAASYNLIGGSSAGMGNLISGNTEVGIVIQNETSVGNQVLGNRIGTNRTGTSALPNDYGIVVIGARETVIGGADLGTPWVCDGPCNLISGNTAFGIMNQGVSAGGEPPPGTVDTASQIIGNFIGTDLSGTAPIPNLAGVDLSWQAGGNQVGGSSALGEGNLLSGNQIDGVVIRDGWANNNQVSGNRIGTTVDGNTAMPNTLNGIVIYGGASGNLIGGESAGLGNVISGNDGGGIVLSDEGTHHNQIINNRIGTNVAGTSAVPNLAGIGLISLVSGTDIRGNLISGNTIRGVEISKSTGNQFINNKIGVAADGLSPLPNSEGIVLLEAPKNTIGPNNIIAYNNYGIVIFYPESFGNTITQNSIFANTALQIGFLDMPVPLAPAPLLSGWNEMTMTVSGTSCAGCLVEVFANPTSTPAGHTYLGTATAAGDGSFSLTLVAGYIYLAATATDAEGTTSEFSNVFQIGVDIYRIYLPLTLK